MEVIRSFDNSKIKHVKKLLADKTYRAEHGEYVAEGLRWVLDALDFAPAAFCAVFVSESGAERLTKLSESAKNRIGAKNVFTVADAVFAKISETEHSQGVLAVLKIRGGKVGRNPRYLYLDGIRDPGNLGAIIRTAVAAGFNDIFLAGCADAFNPKSVRSTMSALLRADIVELKGGVGTVEFLKRDGYKIYAADMGGENIFTITEKPAKICLIIGGEADGVSPEALRLADKTVSIPMDNTESLNAAVAAGIIMYQLRK